MDVVDAPPRRRGRPKKYQGRQYVPLTAEHRRLLDAYVETDGGHLADHIRAAIEAYRRLTAEQRRALNGLGATDDAGVADQLLTHLIQDAIEAETDHAEVMPA